jgi:hypothetical protein
MYGHLWGLPGERKLKAFTQKYSPSGGRLIDFDYSKGAPTHGSFMRPNGGKKVAV